MDGVMMNHNQRLQLRYAHTDRTRVLKDVRKKRTSELALDQIYFVGFRINGGRDGRYHHALIIADDYDSFLDGIAGEFNAILSQPSAASVKDIALVFVRNLMILDPELVAAAESQNITSEIQEELIRRDDNQYLVYGLIGEERICLVKVKASDALLAIDRARRSVMAKHQKELLPLEVCQPHPVTAECCALFDATAERIKPLLNGESTSSAYLH